MIFGKFNPFIDELAHAAISLTIAGIGLALDIYGISFFIICFAAGILIDLDHFANTAIAKKLSIKAYDNGFLYGSCGYTIKILHGFDVAVVIGAIVFALTSEFWLSMFLILVLSAHETWDFIVYPHSPRELLLTTRARCGFRPGIRTFFKGVVFDLSSLKY